MNNQNSKIKMNNCKEIIKCIDRKFKIKLQVLPIIQRSEERKIDCMLGKYDYVDGDANSIDDTEHGSMHKKLKQFPYHI